MMDRHKRYWIIEGFDHGQRVYCARLALRTTAKEIRLLLQRLLSRSLSQDEIVRASAGKRTALYCGALEVEHDRADAIFSIGAELRYTAHLGTDFEFEEIACASLNSNSDAPTSSTGRKAIGRPALSDCC